MTRAGSGFSGSFVSGFPTARLGFTLRRGHEATEHLSTKGTWVPPFLGLVCLSIHVDHLEDDRGAGWGPAREGALILGKVTLFRQVHALGLSVWTCLFPPHLT